MPHYHGTYLPTTLHLRTWTTTWAFTCTTHHCTGRDLLGTFAFLWTTRATAPALPHHIHHTHTPHTAHLPVPTHTTHAAFLCTFYYTWPPHTAYPYLCHLPAPTLALPHSTLPHTTYTRPYPTLTHTPLPCPAPPTHPTYTPTYPSTCPPTSSRHGQDRMGQEGTSLTLPHTPPYPPCSGIREPTACLPFWVDIGLTTYK